VTRDLLAGLRWIALPTVALVIVALVAPGRLELALRIYALLVAATAIGVALAALRRAFPSEQVLDAAGAPLRRPRQPATLARTHNDVVLGLASSFDLHYRLVPRLRAVASDLLASHRDVSLTVEQDRAAEILGPATWELVRPDRPAPEDRLADGIPRGDLAVVVDALEAV
jgi:hypothetical protein